MSEKFSDVPKELKAAVIQAVGAIASGAASAYAGNGNSKIIEAVDVAFDAIIKRVKK